VKRARWWIAAIMLALSLTLHAPVAIGLLAAPALVAVLAARSGRSVLWHRLRALAPLLAAIFIAAWLGALWSPALARSFPLQRAALISLRVLSATLWLSWLTHDLRAPEIEAALRGIGLPEAFIALVFATRRFGKQLSATLHAAWAAGALRAGLTSLRALAYTIGAVSGVVVVRCIDRSERVAIASALRGGAAIGPEDE
jgi:energy-coupling factor transporter transmembrane protein EcfT